MGDVVELNPSNFNHIVMDQSKNVLVEFYAPCKFVDVLLLTFIYVFYKGVVIAKR